MQKSSSKNNTLITNYEKKWIMEVTQSNHLTAPVKSQCECCVQSKWDWTRVFSPQKIIRSNRGHSIVCSVPKIPAKMNTMILFPCLYWKVQRKRYQMEGGRLAKDVWLKCKWKSLWYLQENYRIFPIFIFIFALHSMKTSLPFLLCIPWKPVYSIVSEDRWVHLETNCPYSVRWATEGE